MILSCDKALQLTLFSNMQLGHLLEASGVMANYISMYDVSAYLYGQAKHVVLFC